MLVYVPGAHAIMHCVCVCVCVCVCETDADDAIVAPAESCPSLSSCDLMCVNGYVRQPNGCYRCQCVTPEHGPFVRPTTSYMLLQFTVAMLREISPKGYFLKLSPAKALALLRLCAHFLVILLERLVVIDRCCSLFFVLALISLATLTFDR